MSNRYSQYTWGQYNPLTMQELSLAPVAMRTQHDASIAKAEASRLQLDPYEKDAARAQELKNQMDAKISAQVDLLNKEGFNPNTTSEMSKLNKEYQDLVGPMGEVSKINSVKPAIAAAKKAFLESDDAKGNSAEINQRRWEEHLAKYKGYTGEGKNIDDLSAVKYTDPIAFTDQLAMHAGFTDNSWKNSNSLIYDPKTLGENKYVIDETHARKSGTNIPNLRKLATLLNSNWSDKTSPLRTSIDYTYRNPNEVLRQMNEQLGIYTKNESSREDSRGISNMSYGEQNNKNTLPPGVPLGIPDPTPGSSVVLGGDKTDLSEIDKIWNTDQPHHNANPVVPYWASNEDIETKNAHRSNPFSVNDIQDSFQRNLYEETFKQMTSPKGYTFKNKDGKIMNYKLNPQEGKNRKKVAQLISNVIKSLPSMTFERKIITQGPTLGVWGFVPGETAVNSKKIKDMLIQDLKSGHRKFIDNDGKLIDWNEVSKKDEIADIDYNGYKSALDLKNTNSKTTTEMMPHSVTVTYKDRSVAQFGATRIKNKDDRGINSKRIKELNDNFTVAIAKATVEPTGFQEFKSSSKGLNGLKFKYNKPINSGEEGSFTYIDNHGTPQTISEEEFSANVNETQD